MTVFKDINHPNTLTGSDKGKLTAPQLYDRHIVAHWPAFVIIPEFGGLAIKLNFDDNKSGMPTLTELQELVGGYIQVIQYPNTDKVFAQDCKGGAKLMIMDEEGKLKDYPVNHCATEMAKRHNAIFEGDTINGNCVFLDADLLD